MSSVPKSTKAVIFEGTKNGFEELKFVDKPIAELGPNDVCVRIKAVSLNYRDLIIPMGKYPFPLEKGCVAASDGAGEVVAVGNRVKKFQKGDRVASLFNQGHQAGAVDPPAMTTGLGGALDGVLAEYVVLPDTGIVRAPTSLSFEEAATLPCAGLTAWNALYGLKPLKPGQSVLVQGTGGVSLFALQFALAAGAQVIATTSSDDKMEALKKLGAHHVINYKKDANWGETAKSLSPLKEGVDHVIEVGGPATMKQSLAAIKLEGVISIIGFLGGGGSKDTPTMLDALGSVCIVRGIYVGSRQMMEEMNAAIEQNNIKPILDEKVFKFDQTKEAYQHQWDQKHFGKVVITL